MIESMCNTSAVVVKVNTHELEFNGAGTDFVLEEIEKLDKQFIPISENEIKNIL